ncbi:MAG: hypothetical protein DRP87_16065 [Spirochaetes bacterium]|nr:MAG: hypothetical protein DRP87_16065 [Spirochaetota bacterium]
MSIIRKMAIQQKRAMVRVRYIKSREPATIGVCPACWNIKERRQVLLKKLNKMGLEVVYKGDRYDGFYHRDKNHSPGCPYRNISPDPWKRFRTAMEKKKRTY